MGSTTIPSTAPDDWRNFDPNWNPAGREIDRRIQQKMKTDPLTGWQQACEDVLREDPKLAEKNWEAYQTQNARLVKKVMAQRPDHDWTHAQQVVWGPGPFGKGYATAQRMMRPGFGQGASNPREVQAVDAELSRLTNEKIAASDVELSYIAAYKLVLSDRPDLVRHRARAS